MTTALLAKIAESLSGWRRAPEADQQNGAVSTARLMDIAAASPDEALRLLSTRVDGLTSAEAAKRLRAHGPNEVAHAARQSVATEIMTRSVNPLNVMLLVLATVSFALGDQRAAIVIAIMVVLSISLEFVQEHRSTKAAEALRRMVQNKATVCRKGGGPSDAPYDIAMSQVVPGDIVLLSAGDMIPADVRLLSAKDLFVNQSALTGEAMPVEKHADLGARAQAAVADLANVCFMGSAVVSGAGRGVVVHTGSATSFGEVADAITGQRVLTAFDKGIERFTWMMLGLIAIMVPLVFVINGLSKGNWFEALLFAVAVAVGLTPEMLPMIVTVNLAKGAMAMSKKRVIVKRLNAIQNFGAMDILCTDKTGTLTQDQHHPETGIWISAARSSMRVSWNTPISIASINRGLKNLLDIAVLKHVELHEKLRADEHFHQDRRNSLRLRTAPYVGRS